jgi:hypothetical protein
MPRFSPFSALDLPDLAAASAGRVRVNRVKIRRVQPAKANPVGKTKRGKRGGWISKKGEYEHKRIRPPGHFDESSFRTVPFSFISNKDEQAFVRKQLKGKRITPKTKVITGRFLEGVTRGRVKGQRVKHLGTGVQAVLFPLPKKKRKAPAKKKATRKNHHTTKPGRVKYADIKIYGPGKHRQNPPSSIPGYQPAEPAKKRHAALAAHARRYGRDATVAALDELNESLDEYFGHDPALLKKLRHRVVDDDLYGYVDRLPRSNRSRPTTKRKAKKKAPVRKSGQRRTRKNTTARGAALRVRPAPAGLTKRVGLHYRSNPKRKTATAAARRLYLKRVVSDTSPGRTHQALSEAINYAIATGAPPSEINALMADQRWLAKEYGLYHGELSAAESDTLRQLVQKQRLEDRQRGLMSRMRANSPDASVMVSKSGQKGFTEIDISERTLRAWVKKYRYDLTERSAEKRRKALAKSIKAIGADKTDWRLVSTAWHMGIAARALKELQKQIPSMSKRLEADAAWLRKEERKTRKNPGRLVILANPSKAHKATPARGSDTKVLEDAAAKMKGRQRAAYIKLVNASNTTERKLLVQALRRFHSLHGTYPTQIKKTDVKMPGKGKRFMVGIGKADHVGYHANKGYKGTKKSGTPWRHHFENNQELVTDEAGKSLAVIGKGTKVTDFIHG